MYVCVLILLVVITGSVAEKAPCNTGYNQCGIMGSLSVSYINNNIYCCPSEFSLRWRSEVQNGTTRTVCICDRQFYESDCIEGQAQCQGATSTSFDGAVVRCCQNGETMNSASVFINGARSGYCKCRRQSGMGIWAVRNSPSSSHEQQMLDQLQYWGQNGLLTEGMQYQANAVQKALNPNARSGGLGQWVTNFLEGLAQGLQGPNPASGSRSSGSGSQQVTSGNATSMGNSSVDGAAPGLISMSSTYQRRNNRIQQRLQNAQQQLQQQQRQIYGGGGLFSLFNPASWYRQNPSTSLNTVVSNTGNTARPL
ncbi:uncharacterized protein LOC106064007 isoform X2 [Biomphalaria glabrata]|uniref:Uncharacterized protein LOC106064007 isoform X2 n=1 Tax=Biomphalaria glabrata TaxID=6526 RepID=A0A9W2Z546_BIOGL|nr:uncharacterized protein LOC106064007 isoform X2 [Biomphalaria glabrata]